MLKRVLNQKNCLKSELKMEEYIRHTPSKFKKSDGYIRQ